MTKERRMSVGLATAVAVLCLLVIGASPAAAAPTVAGGSATEVQGTSALLGALVDPGGEATSVDFEYVAAAGFAASGFARAARVPAGPIAAGGGPREVTAAIAGLSPATAYYFRAVAGSASGTEVGPAATFSTTAGFGLLEGEEGFRVAAREEDGSIDNRAGSHPYSLTTEVDFRMAGSSGGAGGVPVTDGDVKDLSLELPAGLFENPTAVPQCSQSAFLQPRVSPHEESRSGESCPDRTQIGVVTLRSSVDGGSTRTFGVYNLAPPPGAPAELGFNPYGSPITFIPRFRESGGEYGLTLVASNLPQKVDLYGFRMSLWGAPWSVTHNAERGNCLNEVEPAVPFGRCSIGDPTTSPPTAYLTLPTTCATPMSYGLAADSWQQPGTVRQTFVAHYDEGRPVNLVGCNAVPFRPEPTAVLTNPRASSPSGLNFDIGVETLGFLRPKRLAPSPVKTAVVELPEGVTVNPSVGSGLGVCRIAEYESETFSTPPGAGCPNASKIGDLQVNSPLFAEPIPGSLYLAAPHENQFDSLLGLYLVAKSPQRGILVKIAGDLTPDPATGRLTATFEDLPQIPYANLEVRFREGQRSPIATPPACGASAIGIALSPWLNPAATIHTSSPLAITSGIGGGPCPVGTPPFAPQAQAGSLNSNAGAYTPFYLHLTRDDAEQEITSFSAVLPPGLTGKLAGIPYCPDADIEAAKHRGGFEESEHPSCPASSLIGHTVAGYGLGSVLSYAPGNLYLAGPFHGSSFSIVAIDSATVGPFDLGVVVVRSAIEVNPLTAQVSIDSAGSDPIPHIIDGIPLHLRDIRVYISRPELTLNPTSCAPFTVSSRLNGSGASFADSGDDTTATATSEYQASNCGGLGLQPALSLRLQGGTRRGAFPALHAELRPRPGDANLAAATVTLPPSEFLEERHIKTICTREQFAREACPAASIYGYARAYTPLLSQPLEGNVYLRSSDNKLPDLVAALRGGGLGLRIDVDGRIDSVHGGLRGTFEGLPDAPVSRFTLNLTGGKKGLLVNSEDICTAKRPAAAIFTGQNNAVTVIHPRVEGSCGKGKKKQSKPKRGGKGKKGRSR